MKKLYFMLIALFFAGAAWAQTGSISGSVEDASTGEPLVGANIVINGTIYGVIADYSGDFTMSGVPGGSHTLVITYLGYERYSQDVVVRANETTSAGRIKIGSTSMGLAEVQIISSVAIDRKTPVAVSTIDGAVIEEKLGSQEFPEILRSTPSVYVTKSGGGFGDSRINVRGFDQRNTAVMINGIPVNDMENGWVYWSNWAGLSDVTADMQIQRGLGASKLAIGSVGGTINIITKTTEAERGGAVSVGVGNDGYLKGSLAYSTGRMKGGWAVSLQGTRTQGDGYIDGTFIDAYSYFASVAKEIGNKHRLVFTAIGAPQRHGQRTGFFGIGLGDFDENGKKWNPWLGQKDGEDYNFRENFYHKPQVALNHYWNINSTTFLSTSAYVSFGRGGGTGDIGRVGGSGYLSGFRKDDNSLDVDGIHAWNSGTDNVEGFPEQGNIDHAGVGLVTGERNGIIRRASMNEHNWMGVLSTMKKELSSNLNLLAGIDLRQYTGKHYRRVDDLMGSDTWLDPSDVNAQDFSADVNGDGEIDWWETGTLRQVGDKIRYDNDGVVGWQGLFSQLEYDAGNGLSAFVAGSVSNTSQQRVDRFAYTVAEGQTSETASYLGYTAKVGANYNINKNHNIFANAGTFSRAPDFDATFLNFANDINEEAINESVQAFELGYGLRYSKFRANVNVYNTTWKDKTESRTVTSSTGQDFTANITGIDAVHSGIEFDASFEATKGLTFSAMASLGDWQWKSDLDNVVILDDSQVAVDTVSVYADGLKVGDAAQTTLFVGADYRMPFGLSLNADYYHFDNLYANYDPTSRTTPDAAQAYQLPAYGLLDLGLSYDLPIEKVDASIRVNVNNVLDTSYVAEAFDGTVSDDPALNPYAPLQGYYGFGRTWSTKLTVRF
ncbi:TonB-dependent receptor [Chitinophagales bacterium]|nr:TonB-dependent receptor [Chitinophagales bacterium]